MALDTGRTWGLAVLLAALAAGGCASPTDGSGVPRSERERFEQNRALWRAQGVASYRFEYRHICFCVPSVTDPVAIVVRSGDVASITYLTTGAPVPPERFDQFLTVEELFELAGQALEEAASVTIEYDPTFGYPTRLDIDWRREIADDEGYHQAANLQPMR
jgi:uncharacterized protein DUF6174